MHGLIGVSTKKQSNVWGEGRQGATPTASQKGKAWLGLEVAVLVSSYSQADGERCRGQHPKGKKKLAEGVSYLGSHWCCKADRAFE